MDYINNYCYRATIGELRSVDKAEWLSTMVASKPRIHSSDADAGQIKAWDNMFDVLMSTVSELPQEYDDVFAVFEYVLPLASPNKPLENDPGVRPDVLLLTNDSVVVLEFKQREELYKGIERQTRKYKHRIQKWHMESIGMNKKSVVILTLTSGINEKRYRLKVCSPDTLAGVIREILDNNLTPMSETRLDQWLNSEYKVREK